MNHLLRFDNLGIDENDVRNCHDIELLKSYKIEVDRSIELIRHNLDVEIFTNKYANSEWIIKAKTAKSKIGLFSQVIQNRIAELKKTQRKAKQDSMERAFYDAAYRTLPHDVFMRIQNEAINQSNQIH